MGLVRLNAVVSLYPKGAKTSLYPDSCSFAVLLKHEGLHEGCYLLSKLRLLSMIPGGDFCTYLFMLVLAAAVAFRQMSTHTFPAVVPMPSPSHASPEISLLSSQSQASPMIHSAVMPLPVVPEVSPTTPVDPSAMCKCSVLTPFQLC